MNASELSSLCASDDSIKIQMKIFSNSILGYVINFTSSFVSKKERWNKLTKVEEIKSQKCELVMQCNKNKKKLKCDCKITHRKKKR